MSLDLGGRLGPGWALAFSRSRAQTVVALAIIPMVAVTVVLAATSDHLQRPEAAALYFGYEVAASMVIGLYWWIRRPASRFGPLLIAFGVLVWIVSWQGVGRGVWPSTSACWPRRPSFVLTFYLFLAYPMGRVEPPAARWLMGALVLGVAGVLPAVGAVLARHRRRRPADPCAPACPENVLQIGTAPTLVEVAGKAETYAALALTAGGARRLPLRLRAASRPQRRALTAVAVTSLLFLPAYFVFNFAALDPARRPGDARHAGVGDRRRADPAAARLPHRVAAGRPLRVRGAA